MFRRATAPVVSLAAFQSVASAQDRLPREVAPLDSSRIGQLNAAIQRQSPERYEPPRVLQAFLPIYPASLLAGDTGNCSISFRIDPDGRASDPSPSPNPDAGEKICAHALSALQYWRFKPATRAGEAVRSRFRMPVHHAIQR